MARSPTDPSTQRSGSVWLARRTSWARGPGPAGRVRCSPTAALTDLGNRGVRNTLIVVCDGLTGLTRGGGNVWPLTMVQPCIIPLIGDTFRLASRRDWDALKHDVKLISTAVDADVARDALDALSENWRNK